MIGTLSKIFCYIKINLENFVKKKSKKQKKKIEISAI